ASSFQSSVEINVLQGERPMARDNKSIGHFRLTGIQRALAGVPQIEVTFDIDVNGILKVSARDLVTGRQQGITITADDRMSESEIEQARRDAENYSAQDGERREMIEVQREAESLLLKVNTALGKYQKQIDKQERRQIKNACDELGRLLKRLKPGSAEAKQLSEIRESMSRLKNYSAGLMYIYENDNTNNA
ncbi:MAG: Hsp70 family protein, partial [Clostridia bacterium]|nr:Hsp70 family protein [Clostridia bacterium]